MDRIYHLFAQFIGGRSCTLSIQEGSGWREGSAKSLTKPSYGQEGSLKFIREKSLIHATIFF